MFADRAKIYIRSGKGGDGHVSFRREKYVANGGPDGGDGGCGGDVIVEVDEGMNTLVDYRHIRKYCAGDGEQGGKRNCRGKDGKDIILKVPAGTVFKDAETGKVIIDMSGDNKRVILAKGGRGGLGNQHFATAKMQAPQYAQPGQSAIELNVCLELKVIADVGLVGFPNVGKSSLLSRVSNARPEIANYHFTTLSPHLGVVDLQDAAGFVMADIPGLIEGASEGVGLGHDFLRHIERTKLILHVCDVAGCEGRDPIEDIYTINNELSSYSADLASKPQIIAANKVDVMENQDNLIRLKNEFEPKGYKIYPISAVTGEGIKEMLYDISAILSDAKQPDIIFEPEFTVSRETLLTGGHTVFYDSDDNVYCIEGPGIEKMLGYTNLDTEKGFSFFQNYMKDTDILDELRALGIKEKDTVRIFGWEFEFYEE